MLRRNYKKYRIGKSTIAGDAIHIPKQVKENYQLKKGDILEFYPSDTDFPDDLMDDIMAVLIVRATTYATTFGGL